MKSIITSILGVAVLVVLPITTFASTYQYVNTDGNVQSIVANSPSEALLAYNIGANSGVILASNSNVSVSTSPVVVTTVNSFGSNTYMYVNTNGNVQTINANSPAEALLAYNIGAHSGVMAI